MNKPIVFDLDGTLFQAHLLAVPAYIDTLARLKESGKIKSIPKREDFTSLLGMTEDEIWGQLLPEACGEIRNLASDWMGEAEDQYMAGGKGALFPGTLESLEQLKAGGHSLFVASNGTEGYVKAVCHHFGLAPLLAGIYSAGEYRTETKVQLLAHAIREHNLVPGLMVGDRSSDVEAGIGNGFTAVACTYGYGSREELAKADYIIEDISQVLDLAGRE